MKRVHVRKRILVAVLAASGSLFAAAGALASDPPTPVFVAARPIGADVEV